jgi:hypothetical protein
MLQFDVVDKGIVRVRFFHIYKFNAMLIGDKSQLHLQFIVYF